MAKQPTSMEDLAGSYMDGYEPEFDPLNPDIPATGEEESYYAAMIDALTTYLYSKEGTANVAQVLQQDKRPLHQVVPEVLKGLLLKTKSDVEKASKGEIPSSVFVAEDGLFQTGIDLLFDLADQLGVPGAQDKEEYAASVINMYKMFGEYILDNKDEDARLEGISLGADLLTTGEGGEPISLDRFQQDYPDSGDEADSISSKIPGMPRSIGI